jgi:hypothetical protein
MMTTHRHDMHFQQFQKTTNYYPSRVPKPLYYKGFQKFRFFETVKNAYYARECM